MRTKTKQNKLKSIITFPIRALVKARDSYVKGMTSFGEKGVYGGFSTPASSSSRSSTLKSYSVNSSRSNYESDDMAELIRVASVKKLGGRLQDEMNRRTTGVPENGVVPRSCSVGMGKIDEDSPCHFGEENGSLGFPKAEIMYPRSKSAYVIAKRSPMI